MIKFIIRISYIITFVFSDFPLWILSKCIETFVAFIVFLILYKLFNLFIPYLL